MTESEEETTLFSGELRTLKGKNADAWSEWQLILEDIVYCIKRMEIYYAIDHDEHPEICSSLVRDTIVTFVSCFDRSVSPSLDEETVFKDIPGALEFFNWLKSLRHSWVAHRHGPARQCQVGYLVGENGDIVGLGEFSTTYYGPNKEDVNQIIAVFELAKDAATKERDAAKEAAGKDLEYFHPMARRKQANARIVIPEPDAHKAGRKKYKKSQ